MNYFIVLYLIIFLFIAARSLRWAIFLVLAALPSYLIRFKLFGAPMTMLEMMMVITFFVWLFKNFQFSIFDPSGHLPKGDNFQSILKFSILKKYKFLCFFVSLFLLSATIGVFISPDFRAAAGIWKAYFIEPILFFIVIISTLRGVKDFKLIVSALGVSAFYISIYAILQRFLDIPIPAPWQTELRVTSIFPYPNAVGLFLAPIIPLLIAIVIPAKAGIQKIQQMDSPIKLGNDIIIRIFLITTCILSILSIYFAKTEAALAALAVGLFFFLLFYNNKTRLTLILICFLFFVFCFLFPSSSLFSTIGNKLLLGDWSGRVRIAMWSETWEMLKDKPIFGAGLAGYQTAILPYHKADWMEVFLYPHNIIFNLWSETGLLGLLSFFLIVGWFFKQIFWNLGIKNLIRNLKLEIRNYDVAQIGKGLLSAIAASMIILLIHGLADVPYFKNDLSVLFWVIAALPIILKSDKVEQG